MIRMFGGWGVWRAYVSKIYYVWFMAGGEGVVFDRLGWLVGANCH